MTDNRTLYPGEGGEGDQKFCSKFYVQMFHCFLFLIHLKVLTIIRIVLFLIELFRPSLYYSLFPHVCLSHYAVVAIVSVLSISEDGTKLSLF